MYWRTLGLLLVVLGLLISVVGFNAKTIYLSHENKTMDAQAAVACRNGDPSPCGALAAEHRKEQQWQTRGQLIGISGGFLLVIGLAFVIGSLTPMGSNGDERR
jgi:hypothetical protein